MFAPETIQDTIRQIQSANKVVLLSLVNALVSLLLANPRNFKESKKSKKTASPCPRGGSFSLAGTTTTTVMTLAASYPLLALEALLVEEQDSMQ